MMTTEKQTTEQPLILISVKEAAEVMRCSTGSIWKLNKTDDTFPRKFKIGGSSRWSKSEIEAYILAQREAA
jgi:predicted DNA-binding transcriptional regulator AlpA